MKYFTLIFFISILFCINVFSQDGGLQKSDNLQKFKNINYDQIDKRITRSIEDFFNLLVKKDIRNAFDNILKNSVIALKREEVDNLKKQTQRSIDIYGDILTSEFVSAELVTDSYIRLRYLALHSSYPMRWIFTFYRSPDKNWIVTNIKFDDLSEYFFSD